MTLPLDFSIRRATAQDAPGISRLEKILGAGRGVRRTVLSEASGTRPSAFLTIVLGPAKNRASVAFHEKLGFKKACEFEEGCAGKKRTIGLYEKKL